MCGDHVATLHVSAGSAGGGHPLRLFQPCWLCPPPPPQPDQGLWAGSPAAPPLLAQRRVTAPRQRCAPPKRGAPSGGAQLMGSRSSSPIPAGQLPGSGMQRGPPQPTPLGTHHLLGFRAGRGRQALPLQGIVAASPCHCSLPHSCGRAHPPSSPTRVLFAGRVTPA